METTLREVEMKLLKHLEQNSPTVFWDYRDELPEEYIQSLISGEKELYEIEDDLRMMNEDYIYNMELDCISTILDEFETEISNREGTPRDEWEEEYVDFIRDNMVTDMNSEQLMKNSGSHVFFYNTGEEFEGYPKSEAQARLDRMRIKKRLHITSSEHDANIMRMLYQASYGGQLVVYFRDSLKDVVDCIISEPYPNIIRFKDAHIAIIDICNGSGDDTHIPGHSFRLPFNRENLYHEKSIKYNYTYAVCGMNGDWCKKTKWDMLVSKNPVAEEIKENSLQETLNRDAEYAKNFQSGKCTPGDMDITRHKNVIYINDFPCGNKCKDCGTFWID